MPLVQAGHSCANETHEQAKANETAKTLEETSIRIMLRMPAGWMDPAIHAQAATLGAANIAHLEPDRVLTAGTPRDSTQIYKGGRCRIRMCKTLN